MKKIFITTFLICIYSVMFFGFIIKDQELSYKERRKLTKLQEFNVENIMSGKYFSTMTDYFVDHIPLRDEFLSLKGFVSQNLYQNKIENNVIVYNDYLFELQHTNYQSIDHILSLITQEQAKYHNHNMYYTIIPDKNYYQDGLLSVDYDYINQAFSNTIQGTYINIYDCLTLHDYYKTDIHFKQESLQKVVNRMQDVMNLTHVSFPDKFKSYSKFNGALSSRIHHNLGYDILSYEITPHNIDVYNYEKQAYVDLYDESKLKGIDPYDIYACGPSPIVIIENHNIANKEIIVYRDSFASSLMPLLINNYSKITMIDLRYVSSDMLETIDIDLYNSNSDVLFMYSIPVINNSFTLK